MPIQVKDLKRLSEAECYMGRCSTVADEMYKFLGDNKGAAYSINEMYDNLYRDKPRYASQKPNVKKANMYQAVRKLVLQGRIKKKGSYFYVE